MRVVVIGMSGAGKTTLAREIATRFAQAHIDLDAINWQPGWRGLAQYDPAEFARRVTEAIQAEAWVTDGVLIGNYGGVRDAIWCRATHLVWLDYDRPVIMARVIRRSLQRIIRRTELWPGTGNREQWHFLFQASHPIRWAWSNWRRLRQEIAEHLHQPAYAHIEIFRLRHPREAQSVIDRLTPGTEETPRVPR
jgi:adenylate kinase family enzyme